MLDYIAFTTSKRSYMARIKRLFEGVRQAFPDRPEDDPELTQHMEPVLELAMQTDQAKKPEDFATIGAKLAMVSEGRVAREVALDREGTSAYCRPRKAGLYTAA